MEFDINLLNPVIERKAPRIVIYGTNGVGKSTVCAPSDYGKGAPSPIYLNLNNGISTLNVPGNNHLIKSYEDAVEMLTFLIKGTHQFETLILDDLTDLEKVIHQKVASDAEKESIADIPYNAGYESALVLWKKFTDAFDVLATKRKMNIVLLCGCDVKKFNDPSGESFDIYAAKLHGKTTRNETAGALLKGWADAFLFMKREKLTKSDDSGFSSKKVAPKRKAAGSANLVIYTAETGGFEAKNRYHFPERIDASYDAWGSIEKYIDEFWNKKLGNKVNSQQLQVEE